MEQQTSYQSEDTDDDSKGKKPTRYGAGITGSLQQKPPAAQNGNHFPSAPIPHEGIIWRGSYEATLGRAVVEAKATDSEKSVEDEEDEDKEDEDESKDKEQVVQPQPEKRRPDKHKTVVPTETAASPAEDESEREELDPSAAAALPELSGNKLDDLPPIAPRQHELPSQEPVEFNNFMHADTYSGQENKRYNYARQETPAYQSSSVELKHGESFVEDDGFGEAYQSTAQIPAQPGEKLMNGYSPYSNSAPGGREIYADSPPPAIPIERPVIVHERSHNIGGLLPTLLVIWESFARRWADRNLKNDLSQQIEQSQRSQEQHRRFDTAQLTEKQQQIATEQQRFVAESRREYLAKDKDVGGVPESTDQPPLALKPNQHRERSTWHEIVVEHGHAVSEAIKYGEGYQRERRQEVLREEMPVAAAGSSVVSQQQNQAYPVMRSDGLPSSGMVSPTLPPLSGQSSYTDPQHQLAEPKKQVIPGMSNGWLWAMSLLIIAAFFIAAFA